MPLVCSVTADLCIIETVRANFCFHGRRSDGKFIPWKGICGGRAGARPARWDEKQRARPSFSNDSNASEYQGRKKDGQHAEDGA